MKEFIEYRTKVYYSNPINKCTFSIIVSLFFISKENSFLPQFSLKHKLKSLMIYFKSYFLGQQKDERKVGRSVGRE